MSPEEIARAHEKLTGFDLVDYSEIALPLWQLNVEALSLAHRRFQPIVEFVLRGLNKGLKIDEAAGFLGLEPEVVRGAAAQLLADRLLTRDGEDFALSDLGRNALDEDGLQIPIGEQLSILFDGLLRQPSQSDPDQFVTARELEDGEVIEIPAIPAGRPSVSELPLPDVVNYLAAKSGGRREMGRDVLSLSRITRARRIFKRAVGLVFKARIGKELRVLFVVDGSVHEPLQNRFSAAGGISRPGFAKTFSDPYVAANLRAHLGQDARKIKLDVSEYQNAQQRVSIAKLRLNSLVRKSRLIRAGALKPSEMPASDAFERARVEEEEAAKALQQAPIRPAAVYEAAEFLRRALAEADSSIHISSRGLAPHLVNKPVLAAIRAAVSRSVSIVVSLHEDSFEWPKRGSHWAKAYASINMLAEQFARFRVIRTREDRFFHLAWDNKIAMICNRPFLSNHGRSKHFEQFAGYVLQRQDLISAYLERVVKDNR